MSAQGGTIHALTWVDHERILAGREMQWLVVFDDLKSQLREALGKAGMYESRCSSEYLRGVAAGEKSGTAKVRDLERLLREAKLSMEFTAKSVTDAQQAAEQAVVGREARRDAEIKTARDEQLIEDRFAEIVDVEGGEIIRDEHGRAKAVLRGDNTIVEVKRDEHGVPAGFERHD